MTVRRQATTKYQEQQDRGSAYKEMFGSLVKSFTRWKVQTSSIIAVKVRVFPSPRVYYFIESQYIDQYIDSRSTWRAPKMAGLQESCM